MTIVSLLGILLGFASIPVFVRGASFGRIGTAFTLLVGHVFASQAYFFMTQTSTADAYGYFYAGQYWAQYPWSALSTVLVGHITQWLKVNLGATYLDCFMVFQAFGAWGLVILMQCFHDIHEKLQIPNVRQPLYLLFVPSIHFWSSAIGKDAPMFFAVALGTWAAINLSGRLIIFGIAIVAMVLFRAHIALIAILALGGASVLHSEVSASRKLFMIIGGIGVVIVLIGTIKSSFGVDLADTSSVSGFFQGREAAEMRDNSATSFGGAAFPIRLASLLFRPLFFDATGVFGLFASFENIGSLLLFGFLARHFRDMLHLAKRVMFVKFAMLFTVGAVIVLSLLSYNVGLGMRERTMVLPPLFCLFAAVRGYVALKKGAGLVGERQEPMLAGAPARLGTARN